MRSRRQPRGLDLKKHWLRVFYTTLKSYGLIGKEFFEKRQVKITEIQVEI